MVYLGTGVSQLEGVIECLHSLVHHRRHGRLTVENLTDRVHCKEGTVGITVGQSNYDFINSNSLRIPKFPAAIFETLSGFPESRESGGSNLVGKTTEM